MRVLKADEYIRMPWRNGHGETAQVAISPVTATLDDFDWRVSMARINDDGPFSIFPQTDRTLTVLQGAGVRLSVDGATSVELTPRLEPLAFRGDVPADATLIGGSVTDLNVMTRRGRFRHSVRALRGTSGTSGPKRVEVTTDCTIALLVCAGEAVQVDVNAKAFQLRSLDSLLVDEPPAAISVLSGAPTLVYLIEIHDL